MIFGINTTSDISQLLYVISRAVRGVKSETILKYHELYLYLISLQILLLFVYTTTLKTFVNFTCRYFKLSWNTTALSQSNCTNFSCCTLGSRWRERYEQPKQDGRPKKTNKQIRRNECYEITQTRLAITAWLLWPTCDQLARI